MSFPEDQMETVRSKNLVTPDSKKYVNEVFDLTRLRRQTSYTNSDRYVRIYKQFQSLPWNDFSGDIKEQSNVGWNPVFRFNSTKLVSSIFGNVDLDIQNLFNSYNVASSGQWGISVYENQFGNCVARRETNGGYGQQSQRPNVFQEFIRQFLTPLTDGNGSAVDFVSPGDINFLSPVTASCGHPSIVNVDLAALDHILNLNGQRMHGMFERGYEPIANTNHELSAVLFRLSGTEPRYTYAQQGTRVASISNNDPMRSKDGIYMAINLGSNHRGLINTGIFGDIAYMEDLNIYYKYTLILRLSRGVSTSLRNGGGASMHINIQRDTGTEEWSENRLALYHQLQDSENPNWRSEETPVYSVGPLVHMIIPEEFQGYKLGDYAEERCEHSQHPLNKQEYLDLYYSDPWTPHKSNEDYNLRFFSDNDCMTKPVIEAKDDVIRRVAAQGNVPLEETWREHRSDQPWFQRQDFFSTPPCRHLYDMYHKPFYSWVTTNLDYANSPNTLEPAASATWLTIGAPIPGVVSEKDIFGCVYGTRVASGSNGSWEWTCPQDGLNPEALHTKNLKKSFLDYEITTNLEERGKGKIYVDHDSIAHCPLSGSPLICDTFLSGANQSYYARTFIPII